MKYLLGYKIYESLTPEEIVKQASKYNSLLELRRKNSKLYYLVTSHNLEHSAFPKKSKWTREEIEKEAKKYNTRSEFSMKSNGAYVRANGLGILDELFPINKKSDK